MEGYRPVAELESLHTSSGISSVIERAGKTQRSPLCLILEPTRDLAMQTYQCMKKFGEKRRKMGCQKKERSWRGEGTGSRGEGWRARSCVRCPHSSSSCATSRFGWIDRDAAMSVNAPSSSCVSSTGMDRLTALPRRLRRRRGKGRATQGRERARRRRGGWGVIEKSSAVCVRNWRKRGRRKIDVVCGKGLTCTYIYMYTFMYGCWDAASRGHWTRTGVSTRLLLESEEEGIGEKEEKEEEEERRRRRRSVGGGGIGGGRPEEEAGRGDEGARKSDGTIVVEGEALPASSCKREGGREAGEPGWRAAMEREER